MPFIEANWIWLLIAIVIGAIIIWWVWGRSTSAPESEKIAPTSAPAAKTVAPPPAKTDAIAAAPIDLAGDGPPVIEEPLPAQERPATAAPLKPEPATTKAPSKTAAKAAPKPAAEKIAKPVAKPPVLAKPEPAAKTAPAAPDNLLQLKGVGPKLATLLTGLGVTRFAEIADWTDADIERIDAQLGTFKGRIVRDHWIEQAGYLAKGDIKSFEAKFGKLDGEN